MAKHTKWIVLLMIVLTIAIVGGTYAFFTATSSSNITASAGKINVNYTNNGSLQGELQPSSEKSEDVCSTATISLANDSVAADANIYIYIDSIDPALASDALVWEVYKNGVIYATGNFTGAVANSKFYLVNSYKLTKTSDVFKVYIWLDGNASNNDIVDSTFSGKMRVEAVARSTFSS